MRIDVKKVLFVGLEAEREVFFQKAQTAGLAEFIDTGGKGIREVPKEVHQIASAIKVVRGLPVVEQEETEEYNQAGEIAEEILHLKHAEEKHHEERRMLRHEITRVEIFGDFSVEEIHNLEKAGNRKIQFFCSRKDFFNAETLPEEVLYIDSDHGLDYFIAVNKECKSYIGMTEMHIDRPVDVLRQRHQQVERSLHDLEQKLKKYAKYNHYLHEALLDRYDHYDLKSAKSYVQEEVDDHLFAVEAWIPEHRLVDLDALLEETHIHWEEIAPEEEERIPTHLVVSFLFCYPSQCRRLTDGAIVGEAYTEEAVGENTPDDTGD